MKNFLFLIISLLSLLPSVVHSQYCGVATTNVAITPTTTNQVTASYASGRRAFNFVATAGCTYYFETCGLSIADTYLRLYSTGTGGTVLATGDDNCGTQSAITWTCATNGTYSILMTNWSCATLTVSTALRYRITGCAPPPSPPANDLCGSATSLACGATNIAGTTVNATLKTAPGGGGLASNYGVWYTFVGNGNQTTVSATGTGGFDIEMTIVQGSCASNTLVSSQDLVGSGTAETFTFTTVNGTTYYVYIAYWSSTGTSTQTGTFTISRSCAAPPPIPGNNLCANATTLTVLCPGITTTTSGTTLGATEDVIPDPSCDPGNIQDVWYSFNTGNNTQVDITAALGTATWIGMELYTSCGTLAVGPSVTCDFNILSPNPTTITGLSMNTTYRLRIFTNTSYDTPGSFTIRLNTINNVISLTSASSSQSVCVNNPITNITFTTTGATGATFSGLPSGVSGNWVNNAITISGTPTVAGTYNYTITMTGGCTGGVNTATGTITVNANNTISLSSSAGTNNQNICINTPIINITYNTTGATGATFSGLPSGVSGSWSNNTVSLSGTPTVSGVFNYTVTMTGGCTGGTNTATGTITVIANNTINLTSSASSQSVCINTPMTNITFGTTGANGVTITGLPAGISGSWTSNVVTLSGTPTISGTFNYTVTTTGGCGTASIFGVITVIDLVPTLSSINGNSTITPGTSETYSITPVAGTNYLWEYTESTTAPLWNVIPGSNSPSVTFTWPPSTTDGAVRVTVSNNCNSESRLLLIITNTPLPIELYSFTGQPYNGQVILEWQTATEYNNDYFIIERSSNGFDWIKIKEVDAVGYSAELVKYLTFDEDAREGINYYKLSQVDFNGEIETFYPIAVKLQGTTECDYEFYNLSGQKIDIYYVPTGVYLKKCGDIVTKFLKL